MKNKILIAICSIAIGFSAGRFLGPKEVEIKEVEKIVYQEREVKDEKKDTKSTRREIVRPDGTREIEIVRETQKETHSDSSKETESETISQKKSSNQSNWSAGYYTDKKEHLLTVDRRILGGVFLGVYGRSNKTLNDTGYGIGIRIEF